MGIYAGTQEVLAGANYIDVIVAWCAYCVDSGIGNCTLHIYDILKLLTDSLLTSARHGVQHVMALIMHIGEIAHI